MLGLPGFDYDTIERVREDCLRGKDIAALLSNQDRCGAGKAAHMVPGLKRIADVPIYSADALVRRSPSLQKTSDARTPRCWMNAALLKSLEVAPGQPVLVRQGTGEARLEAALDDKLPEGCVRVAAGIRRPRASARCSGRFRSRGSRWSRPPRCSTGSSLVPKRGSARSGGRRYWTARATSSSSSRSWCRCFSRSRT
jgi:hypothetical protein